MSAVLDAVLGKSKTPREMMREYKRSIDRTVRELDRERARLQSQEKTIIAEMQEMARKNQMEAVKIKARDLVRSRKYVTKFHSMKAQMQAVSLRLTTLGSTAQMAEAMKGTAQAMVSMNRQINLPAMQKIMMEFEKQSEIMNLKEEVMNECVDDAMDDEGDEEEETAGLVAQVYEEIGLDVSQIKSGAAPVPAAAEPNEDDLLARLEKHKGDR